MPHATNAEKSHICVWTVTGLWFTWQISLALLLLTIVIYIHVVAMCWGLDSQGWIKIWTVKQSQCHFYSHDLAPGCNNYQCFGHCQGLSLVTLVIFPPGGVCALLRHDLTLPLLVPSGPRSTVHSSMLPKGSNIFLTSVSVCCFPSIPTNSFLSSKGKEIAKMGGRKQDNVWIVQD